MNQQRKTMLLGGTVAAVVAALAMVATGHFNRQGEAGVKVWFYNQKTKSLYAVPKSQVSPEGDDDNRVRAIVVGFSKKDTSTSQLKVAYLEKYNPEFRALLQRAAAAHAAQKPFSERMPSASSEYYKTNVLVKHAEDPTWHPIGSEEGQTILREWRDWHGPNGESAIISTPAR